jgi:hypothetical protein
MTDRHMGYVVHLAGDVRKDDAEAVISALRMIKGVAAVTPVTAADAATVIASRRRDSEWTARLGALTREMCSE